MRKTLSASRSRIRRVVKRATRPLFNTKIAKTISENNPEFIAAVKKLSRQILGEGPAVSNTPQVSEDDFVSHLAANHIEHATLLHDNKVYWYENEASGEYRRHEDDPRIVAIYLPQFHPFKENDEAWGKGFTEWTNVASSFPRFVGQQQPVLPRDLGFYDLRRPGAIEEQFKLAKKYGIYGFQLYYYWFSGKKVMDMPINTILEHPEWDFHFTICWANENWTRKWDGGDNEIIFEQKNLPEDPLRFIEDVSSILNDERYICEDKKPILTVYRVELLDDPDRYVKVWRRYFIEKFGKELWLVGHSYDAAVNPKDYGFDATMDFTPINSLQPTLKPWVDDRKYLTNDIFANHKLLDSAWRGNVIDFRFVAKQEINNLKNNTYFYKSISPSWSNEARRKGNDGYTFSNSSPEIFANWLREILDYEVKVEKKKAPIVFINAWNEWAEAAMIEPSMHIGHNSLKRIAEVVSQYSSDEDNKKVFTPYGFKYSKKAKLAVVVHLYYVDMWHHFEKSLKNINEDFDLYLSVSQDNRDMSIKKVSPHHKNTNIVVVPNRGRDVLPFVVIMNRIRSLNNYKYILKLHTKKSKHRNDGDAWFSDVMSQLLPDRGMDNILNKLTDPSTGSIGPADHIVSLSRHMGGNREIVRSLIENITHRKYDDIVDDEGKYPFFGSTMFWCRLDFLDPLLDLQLMPSDFQAEHGQIDGTTAHAIERILGKALHKISNKKMYYLDKKGRVLEIDETSEFREKYNFAD